MNPEITRVRVGRWWASAAGTAVGAAIFLCALVGVPAALFENPSVWMTLLQWFSWIGLPVCLIGLAYMLRGALLPDHIHLTEHGVSARNWAVSWAEIRSVTVEGDPDGTEGQVVLHVAEAAHEREKRGNRWLSGRPLGAGGLLSRTPTLRTQRAMELTSGELASLIECHHHEFLGRDGRRDDRAADEFR